MVYGGPDASVRLQIAGNSLRIPQESGYRIALRAFIIRGERIAIIRQNANAFLQHPDCGCQSLNAAPNAIPLSPTISSGDCAKGACCRPDSASRKARHPFESVVPTVRARLRLVLIRLSEISLAPPAETASA